MHSAPSSPPPAPACDACMGRGQGGNWGYAARTSVKGERETAGQGGRGPGAWALWRWPCCGGHSCAWLHVHDVPGGDAGNWATRIPRGMERPPHVRRPSAQKCARTPSRTAPLRTCCAAAHRTPHRLSGLNPHARSTAPLPPTPPHPTPPEVLVPYLCVDALQLGLGAA